MARFDPDLVPAAPDLSFEIQLWEKGISLVAGIDEAGRGALAGPVAAAALVLPPDPVLCRELTGVRDSKQMTARARSCWAERLKESALAWGVGFASHLEIDEMGIVPATRLAACRALERLGINPQHLLVDFLELSAARIPFTSLVKGDARSLSIAGASILAKTSRDALCKELERLYPGYGFEVHKGYATTRHLQALQRLGPSPVHRLSFKPVYLATLPPPRVAPNTAPCAPNDASGGNTS